jgi:hypothetical protein
MVDTYQIGKGLFMDVAKLIDETRKSVAYTVHSFKQNKNE